MPDPISVCVETNLKGLPLYRRGKVRDIYEAGDRLLMIATDRVSAFDVVMPTPIPMKGAVLTQLDSEAATELRHEFGLEESGLERTIRLSCALLELIFFFTTASDELKAWSIRKGTTALKGAGKIHSDMERGFIRAEVVSFTDLIKCNTIPEARKHGLLRLEGKNYIIQDGDIITFLFNV